MVCDVILKYIVYCVLYLICSGMHQQTPQCLH